MKRYAIVIEKGATNYGAYVPDLPGCVSCADEINQLKTNIREAIEMYIEDMLADGEPVPEPTAQWTEIAVGV